MFEKHHAIPLHLKARLKEIKSYRMYEYSLKHAYIYTHEKVNYPFTMISLAGQETDSAVRIYAKYYQSTSDGVPSFLVIPHTSSTYETIEIIVVPVKKLDVAGEEWDFMAEDFHSPIANEDGGLLFLKADTENITVWTHLQRATDRRPPFTSMDGNSIQDIVSNLYTLAVTHQCAQYTEERARDAKYFSQVYPECGAEDVTNEEVFINELGIAFYNVIAYDSETVEDMSIALNRYRQVAKITSDK